MVVVSGDGGGAVVVGGRCGWWWWWLRNRLWVVGDAQTKHWHLLMFDLGITSHRRIK